VADVSQRELKDSGKRQEFDTGAVRDLQENKGRYDLIPPHGLYRLAVHFEKGCKKYGERNWEKGIDLARYWNSANRHWQQVLAGEEDEDHATAALWNIICWIETNYRIELGILPKELDNMNKMKGYKIH